MVFSLIPLVLALGAMIRSKVVLTFQFMLVIYALMSYIIPILALSYFPWYLETISQYDGSIDSEINWALMALGDIAAVQIALILAGYKETNFTLNLKALHVRRAVGIGFALVFIMMFFVHVLGTGKYDDGNMTANPVAQLLQPQYVVFILVVYALNYKIIQQKSTTLYGVKPLVVLYLVFAVSSGSRSGLVNLLLIYIAVWVLLVGKFQVRHYFSMFIISVLAVLLFIVATMLRGGSDMDMSTVFYHADNLYDAVIIYVVKRIGLHENLYQIANGFYSAQIYNEIGLLQFVKSTFDLLVPGTYFLGVYPLAALNQIWLYGYDLARIATEWSSISVGLYSVNYLYFGKFFGWFVTVLITYLYVKYSERLISKYQSGWQAYFGIYMIFSFQPYFLTSFGYEYLIRGLVMGAANIYFWHWLIIRKSRSRVGLQDMQCTGKGSPVDLPQSRDLS